MVLATPFHNSGRLGCEGKKPKTSTSAKIKFYIGKAQFLLMSFGLITSTSVL